MTQTRSVMQWSDTEIVYRYGYNKTCSEEKGPIRGSERLAGTTMDGLSHDEIRDSRNKKRVEYKNFVRIAFPELMILGLETISLTEMELIEVKVIDELDRFRSRDEHAHESAQYVALEEKLRLLQDVLHCIVQEDYVDHEVSKAQQHDARLDSIPKTAIQNQKEKYPCRMRFMLSHFKCLTFSNG
jgi:hypothetical protein